jgi:hypothetical protein
MVQWIAVKFGGAMGIGEDAALGEHHRRVPGQKDLPSILSIYRQDICIEYDVTISPGRRYRQSPAMSFFTMD